MAIFNSYVKFPEGKNDLIWMIWECHHFRKPPTRDATEISAAHHLCPGPGGRWPQERGHRILVKKSHGWTVGLTWWTLGSFFFVFICWKKKHEKNVGLHRFLNDGLLFSRRSHTDWLNEMPLTLQTASDLGGLDVWWTGRGFCGQTWLRKIVGVLWLWSRELPSMPRTVEMMMPECNHGARWER